MARDDDEPLADERQWQEIVDNFGERVVLEPDDPLIDPTPHPVEPEVVDDPVEVRDQVHPDDDFVPPTPPPLPRPPLDPLLPGVRGFGGPPLLLFFLVLRVSGPSLVGVLPAP